MKMVGDRMVPDRRFASATTVFTCECGKMFADYEHLRDPKCQMCRRLPEEDPELYRQIGRCGQAFVTSRSHYYRLQHAPMRAAGKRRAA